MIRTIEAYDCECEVCGHVWFSATVPDRCGNRECRSRIWNRSKALEKPAVKIERRRAPEIQKPIEPEMPRCKYEEYDPETGETYRCSLPEHGPKVKHVKATT